MAGPEFFQTRMGARFFESEFPKLVKSITRIADSLEPVVVLKEAVEPWDNDELQFARLLCEIRAAGFLELDPLMCADMLSSMDLDAERVEELFKRAEVLFENAKKE